MTTRRYAARITSVPDRMSSHAASTSVPTPLAKTPGLALHRQLYLVVRDQIVRAQWKAGEALPPEEALCRQFGVSRITVRRAFDDLAKEGLVERRHGLGTYVRDGVSRPRPNPSLNFLDGVREAVAGTQVQVLGVHRAQPPADIAEQLQLAGGEKAILARRIRLQHAVPLMITESWIPAHLGGNVSAKTLKKNALYEILLAQGVSFGRVIQEISAQAASPDQAQLLQTTAGAPLLVLTRLIHDEAAQPVQHLRVYMSAERSRVLMEIPGSQINKLAAGQVVHDVDAHAR